MTKRMLIDATHAEETRVVVLDGSRLDEFDVETSTKRQIKSNIYLAKVVRVEPSLQAAFVEYGGNRHGFLAFGEIHPDYYQIPVADRQRLLAIQAEEARREEEEAERDEAEGRVREPDEAAEGPDGDDGEFQASSAQPDAAPHGHEAAGEDRPVEAERGSPEQEAAERSSSAQPDAVPAPGETADEDISADPGREAEPAAGSAAQPAAIGHDAVFASEAHGSDIPQPGAHDDAEAHDAGAHDAGVPDAGVHDAEAHDAGAHDVGAAMSAVASDEPPRDSAEVVAEVAGAATEALAGILGREPPADLHEPEPEDDGEAANEPAADLPPVESIGGADDTTDASSRRSASRALRSYKIQEVIKRRQILLVQVVKEERGGKGAALTTYISLAGRYCVLMPNSPRGGGVSRKITSVADRRRLKEVTAELDLPQGMGLIVRTAGAARPKPEIMRDCEYLLRLWDDIRELTMQSMAPALIYEEASLIKRAIRDVYSRDIDEIVVDGDEGWRAARNFMATLIPSHARKVQLWNDPGGQKLFARHQVDAQLDLMLSPTVQLKSGGYLVINQTEALVAIDVNSGRSTRERGIEETALRTNCEAADEVARQLRLRDLAGLIVIDFIDMESRRNNATVEKRLKDALKSDRARIQLGTISHFGLMEMSRQRLRPSLAETSFLPCPHCSGTGLVRSTENAAIHVLRAVEEEGAKRRSAEIVVHAATSIALYLLNNKRDRLADIERRYGMRVVFAADESLIPPDIRIDRARPLMPGDAPPRIEAAPVTAPRDLAPPPADVEDDEDEDAAPETESQAGTDEARPGETAEEGEQRRRRRRRRRRGGRREDQAPGDQAAAFESAPGGSAVDGEPSDADHVEGVPERADEPSDGVEAAPVEPAAADPAAADPASEEERRRRRSRRGGRRKRRDDEVSPAVSAPGAEQPDLPPVYAGPTPADPFGGVAFDIFDVMDQAEQAAVNAPKPLAAPSPEPAAEPVAAPASEPDAQGEANSGAALDVPPEPAAPEPAAPEPAAPEPAAPEPDVPEPAAPEPAAPELAPLDPAEPAHALNGSAGAAPQSPTEPEALPAAAPPVVVDEAAAPAEKKRGWWRR